jgi:hypothetical protein
LRRRVDENERDAGQWTILLDVDVAKAPKSDDWTSVPLAASLRPQIAELRQGRFERLRQWSVARGELLAETHAAARRSGAMLRGARRAADWLGLRECRAATSGSPFAMAGNLGYARGVAGVLSPWTIRELSWMQPSFPESRW